MGFCSGIENYSRHLTGRQPGEPPYTLLDYFPDDFLMIIDESHVTIPQLRAMYNGDRSRKEVLVEHGFRLPSALDNRPLRFEEFEERINQVIYVSATPGPYELEKAPDVVEQIIRPTGLLDPEVRRPPDPGSDRRPDRRNPQAGRAGRAGVGHHPDQEDGGRPDRLLEGGRASASATSIRTSRPSSGCRSCGISGWANLTCWSGSTCSGKGWICRKFPWWPSWMRTRKAFSGPRRSLIQTIGRAARNANGKVIMYADTITDSMRKAIDETERRRRDPAGLQREARHHAADRPKSGARGDRGHQGGGGERLPTEKPGCDAAWPKRERRQLISQLEKEMKEAARKLEFERAAELRDMIIELKAESELEDRWHEKILSFAARGCTI